LFSNNHDDTMTIAEKESELLERVRRSDVEAFRVLFARHQPSVFRFVLAHTRDADAAHDVVQETFVRIWDRRGSLQPELSLLALAFRIAMNLVRDDLRRKEARVRLSDRVPPPARPDGDDPLEQAQHALLAREVERILRDDLPEKCRAVFLLSRVEGMSNAEIASTLGIREKTVENHMTRALKTLRRELARFRRGE
jgi:RNA polymerase sigma-70 factor (ECF subfamily)